MNNFVEFFKKNKDDLVKPICVLLCICIIIPLALALTNRLTEEKIANLETENSNATMKLLIDAKSFDQCDFGEKGKDGYFEYYEAKNGETVEGYIFVTSAKGYGGDVSVMTATDTDGKVKEVAILDVSGETPGLGQNAGKENYYSQFSGKTEGIEVVKNGADKSKNQINAVTGATITSRATTKAVNEALENFKKIKKAGEDR